MKKVIYSEKVSRLSRRFLNLLACVLLSLHCHTASAQTLDFPEGTRLEVSNGQIKYTLPQGYILTGMLVSNPNIEVAVGPTGSITCECKSKEANADCTPFKRGSSSGCATTNSSCSDCKMTATARVGSSDHQVMGLVVKKVDEKPLTGLIYLANIRPVATLEELNTLPFVTSDILNQPDVKASIEDIYESMLTKENLAEVKNGRIPAGHKYCPFSINGRLGFLVLPNAVLGIIATIGVEVGGYSCTGCNGSCTHGSQMSVHYCENCNSGCTLKWR
jgi:hypothetical protein